jgi:hypothetical protein
MKASMTPLLPPPSKDRMLILSFAELAKKIKDENNQNKFS